MTPYEYVRHLFPHASKLAEILGITRQAIYDQDTRGTIPTSWHSALLEYAKKKKLDLNPADLVVGRK